MTALNRIHIEATREEVFAVLSVAERYRAAGALGGIDVVLAGAASAAFGPFVETDPEDFDATLATLSGWDAARGRIGLG